MRRIDERFLEAPFFGSRRMARWLRMHTEFVDVDRKRVARLIRLMGLAPIYRKPKTSRPYPQHKRSFDPQSARCDFRVFLLHLRPIGDEFKTARKHRIAALPGDSASKHGRVKPGEQSAQKAEPLTESGPDNPAGQPGML